MGQDFLQRLPMHSSLPDNLPPTDPLHQYTSANLTPLFHICVHPFIVSEGTTVCDRPVTSMTPLHFSAAVYSRSSTLEVLAYCTFATHLLVVLLAPEFLANHREMCQCRRRQDLPPFRRDHHSRAPIPNPSRPNALGSGTAVMVSPHPCNVPTPRAELSETKRVHSPFGSIP